MAGVPSPGSFSHTWALLALLLALAACGGGRGAPDETADGGSAPDTSTSTTKPAPLPDCVEDGHGTGCPVPGHPDRPFDLDLPEDYPSGGPYPLLLVLHGGGGNSETARQRACAGGDLSAESCFHAVGDRQGFITVYPNGTGARIAREVRTWNAGGGDDDHACVSGLACERGVDDVSYISALLDEVDDQLEVDPGRVYVTGFSNGAAMSHRLACELSDRIAAIAPVSGGNQFATTADCEPSRPVAVLHVHGTADPCWTYEETSQECLDQDPRPKVSVAESTSGWVERLRCDQTPATSEMPDTTSDGMTTTVETWAGCSGGVEVRLMSVVGGGHGYPGGSPGFERIAGSPTTDWGFEVIWEFLSRFELAG